jgi:hypothetical protein
VDIDDLLDPAEPAHEVVPGITAPDSDRVRVSTSGFTLELSLRELLITVDGAGRYIGYDPDADEERYEPASLLDLLVAEAGDKLVKALRRDLLKRVEDQVHDAVVDTITDLVREHLNDGVRAVNSLGQAVGEPTPLAEVIKATANDTLTKAVGDNYGSRGRQTVLQKLVTEAVGTAFQKELQAEVDKARQAAKDAVRDSAAHVIQQTIERATRGL